MLFGIAAVSVPIIIHMLNKRKFQRVVWAAMKFLKVSIEQNQRRMRIEDLLLLLLRCLLLSLLALALARPALRTANANLFGQAKVMSVIILDNSYSMSATDGVESRFPKAVKAAEYVLDTMPAGSATAVWLASDRVDSRIPEPTFDLNMARKVIREAELSDRASNLLPALRRAVAVLQRRASVRKEIYLFTDGQLLAWGAMGEIQKLLNDSKEEIRSHLILIGEQHTRNLAVSNLRLASGLTPLNQPLRFEVQVRNFGIEDARDVKVTLNVNDDPPIDEAAIDNVPAGAAKSVSLFAKLRSEGYHTVTARVPDDRLPADDRRTIAVHVTREVRILLLDGDPGREPRDSETFFLRNALQPVPAAERQQHFVKVTTITPADVPTIRFDDYDVVVLANIADFAQNTAVSLDQFVKRGGGLIIFPGGNVNASFYNEQLAGQIGLLPARFATPRGQADDQEHYLTLQTKDLDHPIVRIWKEASSGNLGSARFFRIMPLEPVAWTPPPETARETNAPATEVAGEPKVVIRYEDGTPAIMERIWGMGRVVMFSSTATTTWNDLPVRPYFIPLLYRVVGSVVQRQSEGLNVMVGDRLAYRTSTELLDRDAVITKPTRKENDRDLRRVEFLDGHPLLRYELTDWSGEYVAKIATEPETVIKFAAQPNPAESSLDELTREQLDSLAGQFNVVRYTDAETLAKSIEIERIGTELWLPFAALALVLATAETFFAHWFSKSK
jgi:hypothetical protein